MTRVIELTKEQMQKRTGLDTLGYTKGDTIMIRKGLPGPLRKQVLKHEYEHASKGEEGPFPWTALAIFGSSLVGAAASRKKQQVPTTQTTKQEPWEPMQPYLKDIMSEAQSLYQNNPFQFYPGQTYAPFTPLQEQGFNMALNTADQIRTQQLPWLWSGLNFATQAIQNPFSNPALPRYTRAAIRPVAEKLIYSAMPEVDRTMTKFGTFGGTRQALAKGWLANQALQTMGDIASRIYSKAYDTNASLLGKGLALAPNVINLGLLPSNVYQQVGSAYQQQQQMAIDEAMRRFAFQQEEPWMRLERYADIINASPGARFGSTTGRTMQTYFRSPGAGALGGALSGYQLGSMLGKDLGTESVGGVPMGALGAIVGGLLGAF